MFVILLLISLLWPFQGTTAWAHNLNSGYSYVSIQDHAVAYELVLPFPVLLQYDTDQNQRLTDDELISQRGSIDTYLRDHLELFNNEQKMDFQLDSLETGIQEQTEDPIVRMKFHYRSPLEIGNVTILYNLFFNDIDPGHQNYIQLLQNGELIEHWVVEKDAGTVRYTPNNLFRFNLTLAGNLVVLGVQYTLKSSLSWLLLLFVILSTKAWKQSAAALLMNVIYSIVGYLIIDRFHGQLPALWLYVPAMTALGILVVYTMKTGSGIWTKVISALFGFALGVVSLPRINELHLNGQFTIVSLFFYFLGVVLALWGLAYIMFMLLSPFLAREQFQRKLWIPKIVLLLAYLSGFLVLFQ